MTRGRPLVTRPAIVAETTQVELSGGAAAEPSAALETSSNAGVVAAAATHTISSRKTGSGSLAEADSVTVAAAGPDLGSESGSEPGSGSETGSGSASGSGSRVGSANGTGSGSATGPDRNALLRAILSRVQAARRYPELARRRELEGTVRIAFSVGSDGRPQAFSIVRAADPLLDAAAREAVERAAPLPFVEGQVEIDLQFQLSD